MHINHVQMLTKPHIYTSLVSKPYRNIGDISLCIGPNITYLTREEAIQILAHLETAIHDLNQEQCDHPIEDIDDLSNPTHCIRCGYKYEYASDEKI